MYIILYLYGFRKVIKMKAISYTHARSNLASTMLKVCEDHDPVIITRKKNNAVVMMSLEDYESLNETSSLLQSPKNAKRLSESIDQLESGQGFERDLLE
jgi:antitoxin YefM